MIKKILFIILIVGTIFQINSANALVSGHYEANGKGCFIAKSLLGGKAKICNCFETETPLVIGGIITTIATCKPDSTDYNQIDFFPIPNTLEKLSMTYLNTYKIFLESINTEKTDILAKCIQDFFESIRNQAVKDYHQSEINYMKTYDSLEKESKDKIEKWMEFNHL